MYYCINCQKLHKEQTESAERLFHSGYILVNESRVPLGICQIIKKTFPKMQLSISI